MNVYFLLSVVCLVSLSRAQDCLLIVPENPLTAQGLATPYLLESVSNENPCLMTNTGASFVQGAIVDTDTGNLFVYNPLVINKGSRPATAPVVPTIPRNHVVGLWFGTNAATLTLVDSNHSLASGNCVNGLPGSIFGQFAYCNAPAFFAAVNNLISHRKITVPQLGTAQDGYTCPTTRSFFIVDQDQSDNVVTSYLITPTNEIAQNTAANRRRFPNSKVLDNGSDEGLVVAVNVALGCTSWTVPDLADPTGSLASLPMNEILAAAREPAPVALVPAGDPMVLNNGAESLAKVNLYRAGVDQIHAVSMAQASTLVYCQHFAIIFPTRANKPTTIRLLSARPSPDPAVGNNLYTFLMARYFASFGNLNCTGLLGKPAPVVIDYNANGVAIKATVNKDMVSSNSSDG